MRTLRLTHLSDRKLLRGLARLLTRERGITAEVLAYLAEVDARKLYLRMGYPSMFEFCVRDLKLSDDAAYKRIRAARTAREFPALFAAVAKGRLHLTAVVLLTPHMTRENADELIAAATHKTKCEIEHMLAQRFPRTEMLPMVSVLPAPAPYDQLVPEPVTSRSPKFGNDQLVPEPVRSPVARSKATPIAPRRYALQLTMEQATHEKLRHAQALLSHRIPSGDLAQVLDRVLDLAIGQLEKRKFAATAKPRTHSGRPTTSRRHIPARVKRAVWERDQGQCTFTSETGHRCGARKFLEYDHLDPVARGGEATVAGIRLLCRAHNHHEAERTFGADFMIEKREAARRTVSEANARAAAEKTAAAERVAAAEEAAAAEQAMSADVIACMRTLGYRATEARRAAEFSATLAGATLEERVRGALSYFRPKARSYNPSLASAGRAP